MIIIREAIIEDEKEVSRVGNRYSNETLLGNLTPEQMKAIIKTCMKDGIALIAEKDGKVVGLLGGQYVNGFGFGKFFEEVIWYVEPEHRGIGVMLYERAIELCKKAGCAGIAMSAYNNKYFPAVDRFYRRQGFSEIERRYYKKF